MILGYPLWIWAVGVVLGVLLSAGVIVEFYSLLMKGGEREETNG